MMKKQLLILVFFAIAITSFAQYPAIHSARPRIYADANRISWLQNNYNAGGAFQADYNSFLYAYNNNWINDPQLYLLGTNQSLWTWNWHSQYAKDEGFFSVFIYKVTQDAQALERCKFIATKLIQAIDTANFAAMEFYAKETFLRDISETGGLLLDWCYDDLPAALRNQLVQTMFAANTEFMNTYILSIHGTSYVSSHNTWNNIICNQNALVLHQAAGLTAAQQATVKSWYETIYDKHVNGFIPCWAHFRDDDGGWNWGAAYSMWSLVDQFQLFENMRIGTDKNFYANLPWLRNSINQYIYFMQPDGKCIHLGDGQMNLDGPDRVMYLHAKYYNDPRSKWLAQYWSQPANIGWTRPLFTKLLYKDYTAAVITQPVNPLNWFSDKVGLSVSRSSWDADAMMLTYFNSPTKRAAHEHRDNNSFAIFKNAPLLLDAGYYDTYGESHYLNYYQRTIAHNSICVFDSTETYENFGQPASNDGGQIESIPLQNLGEVLDPNNKRGEWLQNGAGENYQYNVSDAQQSYNPAKLDLFRRRLLYLKPGKVIVLDHVHLKNAGTKQRDISWLAHFVNRPIMSGTVVNTETAGHIMTYNGKDYSAVNGNGNIAIRTLFPANSSAKLIGGTGYEYWVNGVNYPPATAPDLSYYSPGSWRIEVKPQAIPADGNITYLHTLAIGDNTNPSAAGGIALQNGISIGTDWDNTVYFFPADGGVNKVSHYFDNVSGGRTVSLFATDLVQGTYDVKIDGIVAATASTDSNRILQISLSLAAGAHRIEIGIPQPIVPVEGVGNNHFSIYPNPARTRLFITVPAGVQVSAGEIFNAAGQLVLQNGNKQVVDVATLRKGTYVLKINIGGKVYSERFVKE